MKCAGCSREAKYVLFNHRQPHCQIHFEEAIEGCKVPTKVMSAETWEELQHEQRVSKAS